MKIHELKSILQRKGLAPLYMITGEEAFLRDEAVNLVRAHASSIHSTPGLPSKPDSALDSSLHCDVLYGDETDAEEIVLSAREVSLFSTRRLIIVKWAEKLPVREGDALIPYFASPNPSTTLVFVGSKLDGRLKWVQTLKAQATVVECGSPYECQQAAWIHQQAQRAGIRLDRQAFELLKESAGGELYTIWNEIQKIATYVSDGQSVRAKDVEAVRGREPGTSVFELAGAIARGDRTTALRIIATNLESGEAPVRMLGALLWQIRRIWRAKALLVLGKKEAEVSRLLGIPSSRARDFFAQVHGWNTTQLGLANELIWETDSALKGWGSGSPRMVWDALILALCDASRHPVARGADPLTPSL